MFPAFLFGHNQLEVVDEYTYLGIVFNYNGKFTKAISKQASQGRKAFYSLYNKVKKLYLPVDISLELFDQLVLPVMLYGCEVWGYSDLKELDILHRKYIKMLLGLYKCTPNVMVYGESGCFPVLNHVKSRMTTFYMRLINGNRNKLSYIMYQVLRKKHITEPLSNIPWIEFIKKAFNDIGMTDIWIYEGMGQQTNHVKQTVKTKIKDIFLQNWSAELEAHEYCDAYRSIKNLGI